MFRRVFWFSTGAAAGVWATHKVHRTLRSLAPDSLALRAADRAVVTGHRLKHFALDVRTGMARREDELNEALGLTTDPDGPVTGTAAQLPQAPGRAPAGGPLHRTTGNEDH
ncbi:DUF6167 family protein [Streptomyces sp. ACA25]|uniref:DUF6167 family protein n=1 Tax=Streptomyces sp. ACA25 TaxID=3022596 RepID=UPI0023080974|nr:DUF6167 family protein [Streptomyces sp. ACA25]MDB1088923.1 DUF6167 family protein [Streptomyces sp. ACA25]